MKENGIYTVRTKYLNDFLGVSNKLAEIKIPRRPFVCIKLQGANWLVPLSSINPTHSDYADRLKKQAYYNHIDTQNSPKAMELFSDVAQSGVANLLNVSQYYNAIPVKHKYCLKYRDSTGKHIIVSNEVGKRMKGQLINYLKTVIDNKLTEFIKHFVERGRTNYRLYCAAE